MVKKNSVKDGGEVIKILKPKREFVRVPLSDDEVIEIGQEMGSLVGRIQTLESELKSNTGQLKGEIKKLQIELDNAARKSREGFEMRNELCQVVYHKEKQKMYFFLSGVSIDSGEWVKERSVTHDEMQQKMFEDNPNQDPDGGLPSKQEKMGDGDDDKEPESE